MAIASAEKATEQTLREILGTMVESADCIEKTLIDLLGDQPHDESKWNEPQGSVESFEQGLIDLRGRLSNIDRRVLAIRARLG